MNVDVNMDTTVDFVDLWIIEMNKEDMRRNKMVLPDAMNFEDAVDEAGYEGDFDTYDDGDAGYDAMMDEIVGYYFDRLRERQELYKKLLLCDYHGNHNEERDNLEKELLRNITGTDKDWVEDAGRPRE